MTDTTSAAREAFETWCEIPHTRRARATRREQWGPFLAGWNASHAPRRAAGAPALAAVDPDRRCDSHMVDSWHADCRACGAIEGEACQAPRLELVRPESRKNSQTSGEALLNRLKTLNNLRGG